MRFSRYFTAVDSHTEGMPTRVITGGVGALPGATMAERRTHFIQNLDGIRRLLMTEPRGHAAMSGAILQPPVRDDADWGVVFIEVSGCLPMCGHGAMGVATVLVETGMVAVREPVTTVRLDTPAGLVVAEVAVRDGAAEAVTLTMVPAFVDRLDVTVDVAGLGTLTCDIVYGGNFFAILPASEVGLSLDRARSAEVLDAGLRIMAAINDACPPVHPGDPTIRGCHHVEFTEAGDDGAHARNAMAIHPGWFDRSPCGTGTAARMAQLHARGELAAGTDFVNESLIGTRFTGRIIAETVVGGRPAVVSTIRGRAWITGMGQYLLDPTDPFPEGFTL